MSWIRPIIHTGSIAVSLRLAWAFGGHAKIVAQTFKTSLASAMPGAGRPYSLAVTRASATS